MMRSLIAVLPLSVVLALPSLAQTPAEPWLGPAFSAAPAELVRAADALELPENDGVVVLFRDTEVRYDAEGRATRRERTVSRILTLEGTEEWAVVEASWSPWYQETPGVRVRVITAAGEEHRLDPAALIDSPVDEGSPQLFGDRRLLRAPLPGLGAGALIEEEIIQRDHQPFFTAGTTGVHYLGLWVPIRHDRLILEAPTSLSLRYGVRRVPDLEPVRSLEAERVRLVFEQRDVPILAEIEPGLPPHEPRFPAVGWSTAASWQAVAEGYSELVEQQLAGAEVAAFLASIAPRSGEAQSERIARLLAKVRAEVRYTGLELGEATLVPARPAVTLGRKFGDCKDQATLLVALLRAEGIPAYVALLDAGLGQDLEPQLPGMGSFNHAIVYVPGQPAIWIDPTDPTARAGELPIADQGRLALVAAPGARDLVRTPAAESRDNRVEELREVTLVGYGKGRVVETGEYHGTLERTMRSQLAAFDSAARRENYLEYAEQAYLAEVLGEVEESADPELAAPFRLRLEVPAAARAATDLGESVVAVVLQNFFTELPAELSDPEAEPRRGEYLLREPYSMQWRYRIVLPAGFVPKNLPADEVKALGPARLEREIRFADGVVDARFRFDTGVRYLGAEQFEAFRKGIAEIVDADPLLLRFEHAADVMQREGRLREAIAEHRRLIQAEPEQAIHHVRLARSLVEIGLIPEAERQARAAIAKDGELALGHWALGWVLEHDPIGRRFGPGWDLAGARAALERAKQLDPEEAIARSELAILLEHDAAGTRYGEGADLAAAIEEYRGWRHDFDSSFDLNLLIALFRARRFQEGVELSAEMPAEQNRNVLRVAALAATQGVRAAAREAQVLGATREQQAGLLGGAAQNLLLVGELELAGETLLAAAPIAANPAMASRYGERLKSLPALSELPLPDDDPLTPYKRFLLAVSAPKLEVARIAELMHPRPDAAELAELGDGSQVRAALTAALEGFSVDTVFRIALGFLESSSEGDDASGYRLKLRIGALGKGWNGETWVVKVDGVYKIASFGELDGVAEEALRRLEAGDLAGARQWLDWARDGRKAEVDGDPWAGDPVAHLWPSGVAAEPALIRATAGAILAEGEKAAEAVPILRAALEGAGDERRWIEKALAQALIETKDHDGAAALARGWLETAPDSKVAFETLVEAENRAGRLDLVETAANERLARKPDDPTGVAALGLVAMLRGDAATAVRHYERVLALEPENPGPSNNAAWVSLFENPIPERALRLAERAAELTQYRRYSVLHTLAIAYAELGKPAEAYRALRLALENRPGEPAGIDGYVVGRIAEEVGFPELARELYEKVEKPDPREVFSTRALAERRLAGLGPGKDTKGGKGKKRG